MAAELAAWRRLQGQQPAPLPGLLLLLAWSKVAAQGQLSAASPGCYAGWLPRQARAPGAIAQLSAQGFPPAGCGPCAEVGSPETAGLAASGPAAPGPAARPNGPGERAPSLAGRPVGPASTARLRRRDGPGKRCLQQRFAWLGFLATERIERIGGWRADGNRRQAADAEGVKASPSWPRSLRPERRVCSTSAARVAAPRPDQPAGRALGWVRPWRSPWSSRLASPSPLGIGISSGDCAQLVRGLCGGRQGPAVRAWRPRKSTAPLPRW